MNALEIKNLTLQIETNTLIKNVTISFQYGEIWGIFGPNGAGKTTLLHTMAGLNQPQAGQILLHNENIFTLKPRLRAKKVGLLLQDTEFDFPATVLETVLMGRYPYQKHWFHDHQEDIKVAKNSLQQLELFPLVHRSVLTLSGGEKRRLALASLLTQTPDIYLLDEPTNHLDLTQKIRILSLLKKLAQDQHKLIIMILHDLHLLRYFCDKMIIMGYNTPLEAGGTKLLLDQTRIHSLLPPEWLAICDLNTKLNERNESVTH